MAPSVRALPAETTPDPAPCSTLQQRIDGAPAGSVLDLSGCSYGSGATIDKPLTLRGATIRPPRGTPALVVTADDVTVHRARLLGPDGRTYDGNTTGVSVDASRSAPVSGLQIVESEIRDFSNCVRIRNVVSPYVARNVIEDCVYAGVMVLSAKGGTIVANTVRRIGLSGAEANEWNAYGITATDQGGDPVSSDVTIARNIVESVPTWHGLDTHGGVRIRFELNIVQAARRAAFLTGGPSDIVFSGNLLVAPTSLEQAGCPAGAPIAYCQDIRALTLVGADGALVIDNTATGWSEPWFKDYGGDSTDVFLAKNSVVE